jgi:hypothetical protein
MEINLDSIRGEVPVSRKCAIIDEVHSIHLDSLSDSVQDLLLKCNPVRADFLADEDSGRDLFSDFLIEQHNILIVNSPDNHEIPVRFFYVDTQGYNYARYCGEIIDVDNILEDYFEDFVDKSIKGESEEPEQSPKIDTRYIAEIVDRFCCDEGLELEMRTKGYYDYLDFYPQDTHTLLDLLLTGEDIRVKPKKETKHIMYVDSYYNDHNKKLVMDFVDGKPLYDTVRFVDI